MGFEGFELSQIELGEVNLRVRHGGSGPPLLLLHGYPETHMMWNQVAGGLARDFTVVAPDLRGYGCSTAPADSPDHETYSKRAMARDAIALMKHFGFARFDVAGHDRGGRAGYRLALDHPKAVRRLSVLDIIPTGEVWARADRRFALGYWHWSFLPQPFEVWRPWAPNLRGQALDCGHFLPEEKPAETLAALSGFHGEGL
jgi:haloacetate dehalogenase